MTNRPPIYFVRDAGEWNDGGDSYNEINLVANLHSCTITICNTKLPILQRPDPLNCWFEWRVFDWLHIPSNQSSLRTEAEKLVDCLKGRMPTKLRFKRDRSNWALV